MSNKLRIARHILYLFKTSLYFAYSFDLISTFYNTMLAPFWDRKLYYKYSCDIFQNNLTVKDFNHNIFDRIVSQMWWSLWKVQYHWTLPLRSISWSINYVYFYTTTLSKQSTTLYSTDKFQKMKTTIFERFTRVSTTTAVPAEVNIINTYDVGRNNGSERNNV